MTPPIEIKLEIYQIRNLLELIVLALGRPSLSAPEIESLRALHKQLLNGLIAAVGQLG